MPAVLVRDGSRVPLRLASPKEDPFKPSCLSEGISRFENDLQVSVALSKIKKSHLALSLSTDATGL